MFASDIAKYRPVFSLMSFNVRFDNSDDGQNSWQHRKPDVITFIQKVKPNIFGLQEPLHHQLTDFKEGLPDYDVIGVGRTDGGTKGEYNPILFDKSLFHLVDSGTFWLSDTPEKAGSKFEEARIRRICTWGKFQWLSHESEDNNEFYLFNTHLDHEKGEVREKQIKVVIEFIRHKASHDTPTILMGDFNSEDESEPCIKYLSATNMFREASTTAGTRLAARTFTGFGGKRREVIDHVYYRGFQVSLYAVLKDRRQNGKLLSDHRPLFCLVKTI